MTSLYYWAIKWKSFDEDDLLVSVKQKEYIESQWGKDPKDRDSQTFKIKGETYSYSSIERIVQTTKRILDSQKLLYAAGQQIGKKVPIIDEEGCVVTAWYKRYISNKEYETKYAKSSFYKTVSKEEGGIWMGFRKVMHENEDISDDIEPCTEEESNRLWKSKAAY